MEFAPIIFIPLLVLKLMDFMRYLLARDANGVVTQLGAWVFGAVALMLAAKTDWAASIPIGGLALAKLNIWSQIFAGMAIASGGSFLKDVTKAVDNSNSAAIPTLLPAGPANTTPNKGGVAATDVG